MKRSIFNQLLNGFKIAIFALPFCAVAEIPAPPNLAVSAYLLKDFNSNQTIASYKLNERVEPASLTKVMTAYLVFQAVENKQLKLNQTLNVSEKAWKIEGSKMFVEPNKPVTVDELLHGMIIQSGNDASITLAEAVAGTEDQFADLMNKQAAKLGMKNTHFMNATGLPDADHYTTASDLSLLATALIRDFPFEYKRLYSVREYTYNKITQPNRNRLLWLDTNVDGMKTGHTQSAGYCLIASAKRSESRLVSVVLGAVSEAMRASESQRLLNYGFQNYESTLVYKKAQPIKTLKVWKGQTDKASIGLADDLYLLLPKGDYSKVKSVVTTQQPLVAPLKAGAVVGNIQFVLDNKIIAEHKLVTIQVIEQTGFFGRIIDSIKMKLE